MIRGIQKRVITNAKWKRYNNINYETFLQNFNHELYYRFKANEKNIVLDLASVSAPAV